ncbi:MAG: arginase [Candidatus Bathyarchaeaceae archaeon]
MKLAIVGVPSSVGARAKGQEKAPVALRRVGLIEKIKDAGHEVIDYGNTEQSHFTPDPYNPKAQNKSAVVKACRLVAEKVKTALDDGFSPIILGGDCTIAIGSLTGIVKVFPDLGLIYFDGDADLNTPETTQSGIFDGMVLAHVIGNGSPELSHLGTRYPILREENIVLFGLNPRSGYVDPPEIDFLKTSPIAQFPTETIRKLGVEKAARNALKTLESKTAKIFVHFDVDVIDASEMPAADVPHMNGLTTDEAARVLKIFAQRGSFLGMEITEFNADKDQGGKLAARLAELIAFALA